MADHSVPRVPVCCLNAARGPSKPWSRGAYAHLELITVMLDAQAGLSAGVQYLSSEGTGLAGRLPAGRIYIVHERIQFAALMEAS